MIVQTIMRYKRSGTEAQPLLNSHSLPQADYLPKKKVCKVYNRKEDIRQLYNFKLKVLTKSFFLMVTSPPEGDDIIKILNWV